MVAEMTSITILRMFFVSFKIRHEEVFFLSCFLLFSLGGSSASYCTIGSCVLIVGSGVRLGLSFSFSAAVLSFEFSTPGLFICEYACLFFIFILLSFNLLVSSFDCLPPHRFLHTCTLSWVCFCFYRSIPLFCMPVCSVCPLSYCTAFDIP